MYYNVNGIRVFNRVDNDIVLYCILLLVMFDPNF